MSVNWPVQLPSHLSFPVNPWQDKHNKQIRGVRWSTEQSSENNSLIIPLYHSDLQRTHACAQGGRKKKKPGTHTQVWAHTSGLSPSCRGLMCEGEQKLSSFCLAAPLGVKAGSVALSKQTTVTHTGKIIRRCTNIPVWGMYSKQVKSRWTIVLYFYYHSSSSSPFEGKACSHERQKTFIFINFTARFF